MKRYQLKATKRTVTGTAASRKLREQKQVPAVLYGRDMESVEISVPEANLLQIINQGSPNALIDLTVGRKKHITMLKDIQLHPIKGGIIHIDFYVVSMDRPITATVPIHIIGEAAGIGEGGTVQYQARDVEVKCLPGDIPERFDLDISALNIGDTKTVADLEFPDNIQLLTATDEVVVTVLAPRLLEEDIAEEEEDLAEEEAAQTEEDSQPEGEDKA